MKIIFKSHQRSESKLAGLADETRSGSPQTLTPQQEEQAVEIALENPRFPKRQISEIAHMTGKEISELTLKRMLKKSLPLETNQVRVVAADKRNGENMRISVKMGSQSGIIGTSALLVQTVKINCKMRAWTLQPYSPIPTL